MVKINVEMEDNLEETVQTTKEEYKEDFLDWLLENLDTTDFDDYWQTRGADRLHEITDSNTPIYNKEIDDLYYLYGDDFETAYKNAGIGNGFEDNHKQVAIYCYIEQEIDNFSWDELQTWFKDIFINAEDKKAAIEEFRKEAI